ncbi:XTP/dITP diphosphatase [Alteromonas sp. a30]|uniref:XTP/dITP diphosphatase n=1 Tax=Alteromonas sp. a30 TaxID=2730917 RepID=UPI002280E8F2|nr:XTP/dITP diphosphatase [Alteromonas sp. a30]MCY7296013.1 XTP/dITP diphosphatase [Alteromonas sp. a30]
MKQQIVLATGNQGKVKELQSMLEPLGIEVLPQSQFDVPEAEETGTTFVENAIIKARNAAKYTGLAAIADDSGLSVDALGGAPGVYSARYAGVDASDQANIQHLLTQLASTTDEARSAHFNCVLVFMQSERDPTPLISHGKWEGKILTSPQGDAGFGYDPVFWVEDKQCSAAELSKADKNAMSHRGKALQQLLQQLKTRAI